MKLRMATGVLDAKARRRAPIQERVEELSSEYSSGPPVLTTCGKYPFAAAVRDDYG